MFVPIFAFLQFVVSVVAHGEESNFFGVFGSFFMFFFLQILPQLKTFPEVHTSSPY